jgi:hypothetical protein
MHWPDRRAHTQRANPAPGDARLTFLASRSAPASCGTADEHNWPAMVAERSCMGIAYVYERSTALAAGALLLLSLPLGGCATSTVGSSVMNARAEVPAPRSTYLPVQDLPPKRAMSAMTPDERSKLKQELITARDHQEAVSKAQGGLAPLDPVKP